MNLLLSEIRAIALDRALPVLRMRQRPPTLCAAAAACRALSAPAVLIVSQVEPANASPVPTFAFLELSALGMQSE